jgi:hypothetical protein
LGKCSFGMYIETIIFISYSLRPLAMSHMLPRTSISHPTTSGVSHPYLHAPAATQSSYRPPDMAVVFY